MDWHLTWQDPVALLVAALCVGFALWLRRRTAATSTGCAACPSMRGEAPEAPGASQKIPTSQLSLGRRRSA
jgi:hypothetical protein